VTAYVPLLSFAVAHRYFNGGCSPLEFVPTAACQGAMRNLDLLLRADGAGFTVFCREDEFAGLRQPPGNAVPLTLEFKVFPRDRNFARYTNPLASTRDEVLYLDGKSAVRADDGRIRLHEEDCVTQASFQDWNAVVVQSAVTRQDAVVRPFMIVSLPAASAATMASTAAGQAPAYYVEFASYASYWKYYFLGDIAKRDLSIADLNGQIEFTSLGMTEVVNGRALTFVSSSAIPMQDAPPQRFQLLENGTMGEKVLIKRLPNAAIGQVSKEKIRQEAALVSEMYIN
jgi:hypothetical protein